MSEISRIAERGTRLVALVNWRGETVASAIVDEQDHARLSVKKWTLGTGGYAVRSDGNRGTVYMHREVLGLQRGDPRRTDHCNHNKLDNRRSNLRLGTQADNMQNRAGANANNGSSRYRGVSWDRHRKKWRAVAVLDGRQHQVGRFESEQAARLAVEAFRAEHMPYSQEAA